MKAGSELEARNATVFEAYCKPLTVKSPPIVKSPSVVMPPVDMTVPPTVILPVVVKLPCEPIVSWADVEVPIVKLFDKTTFL